MTEKLPHPYQFLETQKAWDIIEISQHWRCGADFYLKRYNSNLFFCKNVFVCFSAFELMDERTQLAPIDAVWRHYLMLKSIHVLSSINVERSL
ncbi:MAG: hypothetical protein V4708_14875 [Bacteroidota bacterium]